MEKDIWKDIIGYEGIYIINEYGVVKCIKRRHGNTVLFCRVNDIVSIRRITKKDRYNRVLLRKDKKQKQHALHRLVAKTFIPNPNNYPQVNHKNGNRGDNRVENLEWCTGSYNCIHAFENGLRIPKK